MNDGQKAARMINGLIRYRDLVSEAIDGAGEQIDDIGTFDDELLASINELIEQHDLMYKFDSNSSIFVMTKEDGANLTAWLEDNDDDEWYWSCWFMRELRRICTSHNADSFLANLLDVAHDFILMEIKEPVKSGWINKELVGYNLPHTGNILNDACSIICDENSDIDCLLEACRILIVYYIRQDIDKFFIV